MAIQINLVIDQGSKYTGIVEVLNDDGTPFDLTGYTGYSQMRKSYFTNSYHVIQCDIEGDPVNGELRLTLLPSVSNSIRAGRYVYDVEIHGSDDDDVKRVVEGIITLTPQVTKSV